MDGASPLTGEGIKAETVKFLKKHRNWYWRRHYGASSVWHVFTLLTLVLNTLTSVIIATDYATKSDIWRIAAIVLPQLASLFTAFLVQFRLRETWELRAMGMIDLEELLTKAHFIPTNDPQKAVEAAQTFRMAALRVERAQASSHFSYLAHKNETRPDAPPGETGEGGGLGKP